MVKVLLTLGLNIYNIYVLNFKYKLSMMGLISHVLI